MFRARNTTVHQSQTRQMEAGKMPLNPTVKTILSQDGVTIAHPPLLQTRMVTSALNDLLIRTRTQAKHRMTKEKYRRMRRLLKNIIKSRETWSCWKRKTSGNRTTIPTRAEMIGGRRLVLASKSTRLRFLRFHLSCTPAKRMRSLKEQTS